MVIAPKSDAGKALVGVTISMLALSWIAVVIRIWVRKWIKALGADDWLMFVGLVLFTVASQNILSAAYNGVGTADIYLTEQNVRDGRMWFWVCSAVYPFSTLAIKCSICMALLRIAKHQNYRYPLYAIMVLSAIASLTTTLTLLVWCRPINANWDARAGTCPNPIILTNVSYYLSATAIVTDWACAILPAFILWDVQLKTRMKVSIVFLLALGVTASVATIARLAYFTAYSSPVNYLEGLAKIAVWSMLECGLGIIAGSIATFRPLFRFIPFLSHSSYAPPSGPFEGNSHHLSELNRRNTYAKTSDQTCNDVERSDTESQRHILNEAKV